MNGFEEIRLNERRKNKLIGNTENKNSKSVHINEYTIKTTPTPMNILRICDSTEVIR